MQMHFPLKAPYNTKYFLMLLRQSYPLVLKNRNFELQSHQMNNVLSPASFYRSSPFLISIVNKKNETLHNRIAFEIFFVFSKIFSLLRNHYFPSWGREKRNAFFLRLCPICNNTIQFERTRHPFARRIGFLQRWKRGPNEPRAHCSKM